MATVTRERELLRELVALVRGECPSLLNEDSGGDVRLSMAIDAALASPPAEDVQFARDVHMLARRIVVRPERAAELAPHLMRLAERRGALAPGVLRDDEWTPASALSKAYPPSGMIEPGDVIEFAHGNDAPMLQRLTHPAAVEDWNGKLRDRVRQVYTPKAQAPPASDPPGLASLTRSLCEVLWDMQSSPDCWCPHDRAVTEPHTEACAAARAVNGAAKRFHLYNELPLPASDPPGLAALLKEPHFLGWPKTAAAGEYAYSRDAVMVSAAWYERLKALALPASPQAETKGDE